MCQYANDVITPVSPNNGMPCQGNYYSSFKTEHYAFDYWWSPNDPSEPSPESLSLGNSATFIKLLPKYSNKVEKLEVGDLMSRIFTLNQYTDAGWNTQTMFFTFAGSSSMTMAIIGLSMTLIGFI